MLQSHDLGRGIIEDQRDIHIIFYIYTYTLFLRWICSVDCVVLNGDDELLYTWSLFGDCIMDLVSVYTLSYYSYTLLVFKFIILPENNTRKQLNLDDIIPIRAICLFKSCKIFKGRCSFFNEMPFVHAYTKQLNYPPSFPCQGTGTGSCSHSLPSENWWERHMYSINRFTSMHATILPSRDMFSNLQ